MPRAACGRHAESGFSEETTPAAFAWI